MSKGETLEQKAREFRQRGGPMDVGPQEGWEDRFAAAFARKVLEEARPYMKHKALCKAMYWNGPCSCGLAELLEDGR